MIATPTTTVLYGQLVDDGAAEQVRRSDGAFEAFMGRWSRLVAPQFVDWLSLPAGGRWLDVGAGTGALTQAVLDRGTPIEVTAVEPSEGLLARSEARIPDLRARFVRAQAERLPFDPAHFDAAVSALVLDAVSEPELAVAEMVRVVRVGGTVAAYVWDYAAGMAMLRALWDVAAGLDLQIATVDQDRRRGVCRLDTLFGLFDRAGLTDVSLRALHVTAVFADLDDVWEPFLAGEHADRHSVGSLDPERRGALRRLLRQTLPVAPDGTIALPLRAWAIRGQR